jgi:hypothetical protein
MNVASGQPCLMVYYDAESPAVRALCFVKEVFDGVLDGSIEFFCDLTIVLRAKLHFVLIACPVLPSNLYE